MFFYRRLSVQSRLVLLLLFVSISSILVVGYVAYTSATEAILERTVARLEGLRRVRTLRVKDRIQLIRDQVITLSETDSIVQATREFRDAFVKLDKADQPGDTDKVLRTFYEKEFLPELQRNTDGEPLLETYFPKRPASRYLQYHYTAKNKKEQGKREELDDAGDKSAYNDVHRKYHPYFRRFAERFGFQDMLIVDPDTGDVLYTSEKTVELGRNLYDGAFAQTNLANLVKSLRKQGDRRTFRIADFEAYSPNMGRPAAFVASPIFDGPAAIGILVLQFPVEGITRITNGNKGWDRDGLGETGDVYIVGADNLLRTRTRGQIEDADAYAKAMAKAGYAPAVIERVKRMQSTVLVQEAKTKPVELAVMGEKGTGVHYDYFGKKSLVSYGPINVEGLHWVILAKMDIGDVYAPAYVLGRRILLSLVVVALVVSLLAVLLARLYVRPIQLIGDGVRAVGSGQTEVKVVLNTQDEFGELADAFNEMTQSLAGKSAELQQRIRENEDLLLNILPIHVAARVRAKEPQAPDTYPDVTVLVADIVGLPDLDTEVPNAETVLLLNDLIGAFDELTERFGVEKIRTMGMSYLAVCGLSVARVDHSNRVVEFAQELLRVVTHFNKDKGTQVGLRVGVHAGAIVGSVLGRSKFVYELWGATVKVAQGLKAQGRVNSILISPTVQDRLRDLYEFERHTEIQVAGQGKLAVWSIKAAA